MPIFEYQCEACSCNSELLVGRSETPACPKCGSKKMEKLMSAQLAVSHPEVHCRWLHPVHHLKPAPAVHAAVGCRWVSVSGVAHASGMA